MALLCGFARAQVSPSEPTPQLMPAQVSTLKPEELAEFGGLPAETQRVIRTCLDLTTRNLGYRFGSSDPGAGGMDCSGTVFRALTDSGIRDVPRQSDEMCRWVMRKAMLYRVEDATSLTEAAFSALRPGDLLFWTGTYETSAPRNPPVSHVMVYLGVRRRDGKPVIFGASEGRTYNGEKRCGVSVFDFVIPKPGSNSRFYGYAPLPGTR